MKRNLYKTLYDWKEQKHSKPILLIGARQVGKTTLVKTFAAENYSTYHYFSFEDDNVLINIFEETINPKDVITLLNLNYDITIKDSDLLIFDEVQISDRAIRSLKSFNEQKPDLNIIALGSLLGVMLNRSEFSFPVGKVEFHYLFPMSFDEFLLATGRNELVDLIRNSYDKHKAISPTIHEKLNKLLLDYIIVGGMPEAVYNYIENGQDVLKFNRAIHTNIINAYKADMPKYSTKLESIKTQTIFENLIENFKGSNYKFKYSNISKGAKSREYESSLEWLVHAHLNLKVNSVNKLDIPLSFYSDSKIFKVFMLDVGLLTTLAKVPMKDILLDNQFDFKGSLYENIVAQQLRPNFDTLYYYKDNQYELDFVVQNEEIYAIEVKSGNSKASASLKHVAKTYDNGILIKASNNNFALNDTFYDIPLYAVFCIE